MMSVALPRVQMFYFSGTGNTHWVANKLSEIMRIRGLVVNVRSVEAVTIAEADELIASADLVCFGYPVYGSDIPLPMKVFMSGLSPVSRKAALVFCTQWLWSGDGARVSEEFIAGKGFVILWAEHLHMPNNLSVPFIVRIFSDRADKKQKYLLHSEARLRRLTERVLSSVPWRRGFATLSLLGGIMQRKPYRAMMKTMMDSISVDADRCTSCGLCVELCPVENLSLDDKAVMASARCVTCMRCYNYCPESAIRFRGRGHRHEHGRPYRGPTMEFDPVVMKGGRMRPS